MERGRRQRAAVLVLVSLALAGCGAASDGAPVPSDGSRTGVAAPGSGAGAATPMPTVTRASADGQVCLGRASKDAYGSDLPGSDRRPRLGKDEPARLVRCVGDTQRIPGQGEWQVRIEEQAGAGAPALAAALRLPDLPPSGQMCLAYLDAPSDLWAVDASGRAVLVREPVDGCGHVRPEVKSALEHAGWRETGRRRLVQTVPQAAIDTRCDPAWKDMAAVEARQAAADGTTPPAGTADSLAKAVAGNLCVYAIDDRETPAGTFVSGRPLRRAAWGAVVEAMDAAPRADGACTTVGSRFALVMTPGWEPAYVELDGCRRVLLPGGGFRRATPALVRLLTTA